jgi:hypothetical protein
MVADGSKEKIKHAINGKKSNVITITLLSAVEKSRKKN